MSPSHYPSCEFVEHLVGSPGRVEHLQCLFIDWMLLSKQAVISNKQLTPVTAIDIIPPAMKDDLAEMSTRPYSEASHDEVVARYERYLHKLRNFLLEHINALQREVKASLPTGRRPVIKLSK